MLTFLFRKKILIPLGILLTLGIFVSIALFFTLAPKSSKELKLRLLSSVSRMTTLKAVSFPVFWNLIKYSRVSPINVKFSASIPGGVADLSFGSKAQRTVLVKNS